MTGPRGILIAGAVALVMTGAHASYRSWPVTHGTEVCVPAALIGQPADVGMVGVQLSIARIELDVPHTGPEVTESFERVRRVGGWWPAGGGAAANALNLRGRQVYVQLTAGQPLWPGGPVEMRPATVSDAAVAGAVNLAAGVQRVREDGYLWLGFPFGLIGVPRDVARAHARPFVGPGSRAIDTANVQPAADPGVFAVLRVLPTGRAALVGVIVDGTRS